MSFLAIKTFLLSPIGKALLIGLFLAGLWGHGYYTANSKWNKWYQSEKVRQNDINKKAYERGLEMAKKQEQEEKRDEEILQQNEREAAGDPDRDRPAISRDSVQRLNRL